MNSIVPARPATVVHTTVCPSVWHRPASPEDVYCTDYCNLFNQRMKLNALTAPSHEPRLNGGSRGNGLSQACKLRVLSVDGFAEGHRFLVAEPICVLACASLTHARNLAPHLTIRITSVTSPPPLQANLENMSLNSNASHSLSHARAHTSDLPKENRSDGDAGNKL